MSHTHTPEPWAQAHRQKSKSEMWDTEIFDSEGICIAVCSWYPVNLGGGVTGTYRKANASRIVACVNACAGIDTDNLEKFPGWAKNGFEQGIDVRQQRDTLLDTMKILACLGNGGVYGNSTGNLIAQAAIASIESPTQEQADWKASATRVLDDIDLQAVGKELELLPPNVQIEGQPASVLSLSNAGLGSAKGS